MTRDGVPLFRNNLKRGLDCERIVQSPLTSAIIQAARCFDIVRHDRATAGPIRPEPDKRNSANTLRLHRENQQLFVDLLDRGVHGPLRKGNLVPSAEVRLLQTLPHHPRYERAPQIIHCSNERICRQVALAFDRARIVFLAPQIVDHLYRIEWKLNRLGVYFDIIRGYLPRFANRGGLGQPTNIAQSKLYWR